METVLIRVDASRNSGTGHLMRCLLFAEYLETNGVHSVFITRTTHAQTSILEKAFNCHFVEHHSSIQDEINIIKDLKGEKKSKIIVTDINNHHTFQCADSYHNYLSELQKLALCVVSFEELNDYPFPSDVVIIPYVGAEKLKIKRNGSKYLLGSRYFPLRQEFVNLPKPEIKQIAKDILITMGGSDPECITLKVLEAIVKSELALNVNIVIGRLSPLTSDDVEKIMAGYRGAFSVKKDVRHMAEVMMSSDLAITNSGLTKYEMAAVGLPAIVISNNQHQANSMHEFAKYGSVIHLGSVEMVSEKRISKALVHLISNSSERRDMAEKGMTLVDGNGLFRIYTEIISH